MVGEYIRSLRASAGLSQRELAKYVGISPSMLSLVETGRREPSLQLLRDIARELKIPTAALFAVALDNDSGDEDAPAVQRLRELNADLLAAAQHSIVLRRLQVVREQK